MKLCIILVTAILRSVFSHVLFCELGCENRRYRIAGHKRGLAWNFFAAEGKGKPRERLLDNADGFWSRK